MDEVKENKIATQNLLPENVTDPTTAHSQASPKQRPAVPPDDTPCANGTELEPKGGVFSSVFEEPEIEESSFDASFGFSDQEDAGLEWSMFG